MRLFIGHSLSSSDIIGDRRRLIGKITKKYSGVEVVGISLCADISAKTSAIASNIRALGEADAAIFAKGWQEDRACRIYEAVCREYGIDTIFE